MEKTPMQKYRYKISKAGLKRVEMVVREDLACHKNAIQEIMQSKKAFVKYELCKEQSKIKRVILDNGDD